jgi:hypothetical protein
MACVDVVLYLCDASSFQGPSLQGGRQGRALRFRTISSGLAETVPPAFW